MTPPSEQEERPAGTSRPGAGAGPPVADELRFELSPDLVAPSIARDRFDRWLLDQRWPGAQREDLVLALSEAVSNSVEHGYGVRAGAPALDAGEVAVTARVLVEADGLRRIRLVVQDRGVWREPVAPARFRGHGLSIIRACADRLSIEGNDEGTTLTLTTRAAPAPLDAA